MGWSIYGNGRDHRDFEVTELISKTSSVSLLTGRDSPRVILLQRQTKPDAKLILSAEISPRVSVSELCFSLYSRFITQL